MSKVRVIDVNMGIYEANDRIADEVRAFNDANGTLLINVMASPGAGKTRTLMRTIDAVRHKYSIGVMEADIDSAVDAERIAANGINTVQVHTGGECAMDAAMTLQALKEFKTAGMDLVFLENVGNLVCTAEQDTGAHYNIEILSIPEGDDKPLKYPLMFTVADVVLVNKMDARDFFEFDDDAFSKRVHDLNPNAKIFFISAKSGEGFDKWINWLRSKVDAQRRKSK